ncbi:MAG: calcium/sodium antiporter [Bacilli bacterium]|nr:calcium/sodium antiporter [Bacilli bacterium]
MVVSIVLLIVGFILLIKGADMFVDGASNTAQNLKIPKMVIGLTIVAFGTSAPELAVSIKAVLSGSSDIVLGNVVGSNILNILLILGISSLFSKMGVKDNTVKKEIPLTILFSCLLTVLSFDNMFDKDITNVVSRTDGIVILLFFIIFIYYLFTIMKSGKKDDNNIPKYGIVKSIIFIIIGLIGVVIGSNLVVDNATLIAKALNVSEKMIALTIVAFGTSLPELVTSIQAARKGENDIAIGNIIGSNIFNIGVVIGIPALFINNINVGTFNYIDMLTMIFSAILLFVLTLKKKKIDRHEGIIMLIIFITYYTYVILGGIN